MWNVLTVVTLIGVIVILLKPDHYKAIRHELYQVWEDIEKLKGEEDETAK